MFKFVLEKYSMNRMHRIAIIFLQVFLLSAIPAAAFSQNPTAEKKLIEFGWDYPKVTQLISGIRTMEQQPFDGVVFALDKGIFNAFDTVPLPDSFFQYKSLGKIEWKKFTDNFLYLRTAGNAGSNWQDDRAWSTICKNLVKLSKAISLSGAKGIGMDAEYYDAPEHSPWVYKAGRFGNLSYKQIGMYVRKRGKQFIQALQANKPDVKILSFWLLGLAIAESKNIPLTDSRMALFPFFVEGMLEGKNNSAEIIDGNETAYWYQKPEEFILAGEQLRADGIKLISPELQAKYKAVSLAQSVYLDGLYAKFDFFEKGFDQRTKEQWLRDNLYHAYKTADKYIWFYNEKVDWWKGKVYEGVKEILEDVRNNINKEQIQKKASLSIAGRSRTFNFKESNPLQQQDFTYTYIKSDNSIQVKLLNKKIKKLSFFQNSRLIYTISDPRAAATIKLTNKYNKTGSLSIIAEDQNGKTYISYVN